MTRKTAVLDVRGLSVVSRGFAILDNVSWRVERGENWVILGANGSGKTSLLAALTGYLPPTLGEIEVLGERYGAADWRALRTRIGLVTSAIHPLMMSGDEPALKTVASGRFAMLGFWGEMTAADEKRARRILKWIECERLVDRAWRVLSQGERQRVLIGRALMASPRLLILDEPCAGLDPAAREHFLQFVTRLGQKRGGPALVFVTHHVEEIAPVFSHVLLLRRGGLLAAGKKEATLSARLLSAAFDARVVVRRERGRYRLSVKPHTRTVL